VVRTGLWASAFSTYKKEYLLENGNVQRKGRTFSLEESFLQGVPYPIAYEPSDLYLQMALKWQVSKNRVG